MAKKRTSPAALVERRQAYYQVIYAEEGERFEAELRSLYTTLFPEFAKPFTRKRPSRISAKPRTAARLLAHTPAMQRLKAIRARDKRKVTDKDHARVTAFVRAWTLPPAATQDVWDSFLLAQYGDAPPRLVAMLPPNQHPPKRRITLDSFLYYDPLLDPTDAVDQHFADTRRALIERAKGARATAFKQARRRLLPPPFWHRPHTMAMALRFYQRVRLGWSPTRIATAEGVDPHRVQVSVSDWAEKFGTKLPPLKTPQ